VRVDGNHGAIAVAKGVLRGALDIEVDGELEALAGLAGSVPILPTSRPWLSTTTSWEPSSHAGCCRKKLRHRNGRDIAGFIHGVAGVVEHVLADLADVADEMGGEAVAGIEAALLLDGFQFGELVLVGLDEFLFVRVMSCLSGGAGIWRLEIAFEIASIGRGHVQPREMRGRSGVMSWPCSRMRKQETEG